jgi:hypothetical protein
MVKKLVKIDSTAVGQFKSAWGQLKSAYPQLK